MHPPWIAAVERSLRRWSRSRVGQTWVVAVSGGSDSVGLLRVLHGLAPRVGLRLSVAHLDHGVRGESARDDARFVSNLAESLGLPFDLGHWQPAGQGGFEAKARRARYDWLCKVAREREATAIAVGHTHDDQAETILHRIVRGTGIRGLEGIPARRTLAAGLTLVRPLLKVSRNEIRTFLSEINQPYREDATNADLSRTRARIRHDLLPRLGHDYNPRVAEALVRLGELAGSSTKALHRYLRDIERSVVVTEACNGNRIVLLRQTLLKSPPYLRAELLRATWKRAGWPEAGMSADRWRRLASLVRSPDGKLSVGSGVRASTNAEWLVLERDDNGPADEPTREVPLAIPGRAPWGMGTIVAALELGDIAQENVDFDALVPPLYVRAPADGDRFAPLGMGGRHTPLNDFFRGRGVAQADRRHIPLVCDKLGIIWVAGHRIADRVRLTERTERTLGLRWEATVGISAKDQEA